MASLSLREAAEQAGTSKSTIWRAIKSGRMSATRTDDGGFAIDPAELFRAFQPQQLSERVAGQDATAVASDVERPVTPETANRNDDPAVKLAVAEAELAGLKALLAEVKANRDEFCARTGTNCSRTGTNGADGPSGFWLPRSGGPGGGRWLKVSLSTRLQHFMGQDAMASHSLFRQGCLLYDLVPNMPEERLRPLLVKYDEFLNQNRVFTQAFGFA